LSTANTAHTGSNISKTTTFISKAKQNQLLASQAPPRVFLSDRMRKNSGNDRKQTQFVFSQCKNDQCGSKNTRGGA
jgi:hypothetical protein